MMKMKLSDLFLVIYLVVLMVVILALPTHSAKAETFTLRIPTGTEVAGVFDEFREIEQEYEILSTVHFRPGDFSLPLESGTYSINLFEKLELGPERKIGIPHETGTLTVERIQNGTSATVYYTIQHDVDVEGMLIHLKWDYLNATIENGTLIDPMFVVEEPYLSRDFYMIGTFNRNGLDEQIKYASKTYEGLPSYRLNVDLENGQTIQLYYHWQQPFAGSGPANLVYAEVNILEGQSKQADYWKLVYSAFHHNWDEKFWVLFDRPMGDAYGVAVFRRNVTDNKTPEVYTLDMNLQPLRQIAIEKMTHEEIEKIPFPSAVEHWKRY